MQAQEAISDRAVVLAEARSRARRAAPRAQQRAVLAREVLAHERGDALAGGDERGLIEQPASIGIGGDGKAVPRGQCLVVAARLRAQITCRVQLLAGTLEAFGRLFLRQARALGGLLDGRDDAQHRGTRVFKVAIGRDVPDVFDERRVDGVSDDLIDLTWGPDERQSLLPIRVGVLPRGEPALGQGQLAVHVPQRRARHVGVLRVVRRHGRVRVRAGQQCVVVEHLLEVRHEPVTVDGVAMEAPADLVADAAVGHAVEREARHVLPVAAASAIVTAEQEWEDRTRRELRRTAEATVHLIEHRRELGDRAVDHLATRGVVVLGLLAGVAVVRRLQRRRDALGLRLDVTTTLAIRLADGVHHLLEARHPGPVLRRKVRAAVEGPAVGGEPHRHRPAAVAGQADDGLHVERVHVGALLAIHLHVDEQAIHHRRRLDVLERLVRHHVTPVARRVADAQQDGHIALGRLGERGLTPGLPINRIVRMLEQIRGGLVGEAIGHTDNFAVPGESVRRDVDTDHHARGLQPLIQCDHRDGLRQEQCSGEVNRVE